MSKNRALLALTPLALCGVLFLVAKIIARYRDNADTWIDKAIEAHGGVDNIGRSSMGRLKGEIRMHLKGERQFLGLGPSWTPQSHSSTQCEQVWDVQTGRLKVSTQGVSDGKAIAMAFGVRDGKAWRQIGQGSPQPWDVDQVLQMNLTGFLDLLFAVKEPTWTRTLQGRAVVNGKPAMEIKVAHADSRFTAKLYFDLENHLLVQTVKKYNYALFRGEVDIFCSYGDYKSVEGVLLPFTMKMMSPERMDWELRVTSLQFLDEIDDSEFDPPLPP